MRAILTDIEGTTTSLSFVKDVLFPYAREHLAEFVAENRDDPAVQACLHEARELDQQQSLSDEETVKLLLQWIDEDRKATPLKTLQGMIWQAGYAKGDYQGHVYADAVDVLRTWHQRGIKLYIFSSGSVQAQKLLFAHTAYGDLTPLFSGYFDTKTGAKRTVEAYQRIAEQIDEPAADVLFLSDIVEELDAARDAGMQTTCLVRDGEMADCSHTQVRDFTALQV